MSRWLLNSCVLLLAAVSLQARLIPPLSFEDLPRILPDIQSDAYSAAISPRVDDNSEANYRLPNTTIPEAYRVELWTNVHNGTRAFNGSVQIDIQVLEATSEIKLHFLQTEDHVATIISRDTVEATAIPLTVTNETLRQFLILNPTDASVSFAKDSNWTITITYNGTLRSDMGGFYMSSYTGVDNEVHYLATTQFESTNARHAFPCYDEPNKRANFTITIHHDPSFTAISNMPVNETISVSGVTAFQTSPRMSTYLVAFIVTDMGYTGGEFNQLPQRVFSQKGKQGQQEWTLWSGLVVENSLANYFGVPFALPKLDQAGIPDFSAGAMENWGLATYREQYMWWSKENSTINLKTNIANIIGHEYAHMWFGDLVSIQWWTYLWLKEGFATLFSYESNDIAFPEWDTYQIYHVNDYNSALINDGLASAVPMTHYVQTPSEISGKYNTFSYAKPSAVLYMFKNAWSDAVFKRGLNKYLTKNQYTSCDEWDLFAAFQESANELGLVLPTSVDNIFSSWSQQAGYPLLTVTRDYSAGTFTVTQRRYLADDNTNDKTWYVPINFATASKPDYRNTSASHYLLNTTETVISDAAVSGEDWLILNLQNAFYYRTLYDEQNYQLLVNVLNEQHWKIHHRNRAQLLYDSYIFANTGRLSPSVLMQLFTYLSNELAYAPWSTANTILSVYNRYLRGADSYYNFQSFVRQLIEPTFDKIGVNEIPGEHYLNNYLRVVLINLASQVGSTDCHRETSNKLSEFLFDGVAIEPTLKTQAYCAGLRSSTDVIFNRVISDLLDTTDATDRSLFISSLGCSLQATQLNTFFNLSIDSTNSLTYSQRTTLLSAAYAQSEEGVTASLEFLESNWEAYAKLSDTAKPLDTALRGIATYVVSEKQKTRLNALVETVKAGSSDYLQDDLTTVIETRITANLDWVETNGKPVLNWVQNYFSENASTSLTATMGIVFVSALTLLLSKLL